MKPLMARRPRSVLRDLARGRTLLAFDFDGTLAPILREPGAARMRPATRSLLREAARHYRCAVVTGRALGDLRPRVAGLPLWALVGNHGAEDGPRRPGRADAPATVRSWRRALSGPVSEMPGVWIEDKRYTLTIHFREARNPGRSRRAILRLAGSLRGARLVAGTYGVNILPVAAPDKGTAVRALRRRARSDMVLFVGDDDSDESVFSDGLSRGLVGVRVGRSRRSRAAYYLRNQAEIDDLLAALIALRAKAGPRR